MSVYKREGHWHFSKTINGVRQRGALPTARNKVQAEQAEAKIILELHKGEYCGHRSSPTLNDFVDRVFVPWAKANRRSWKGDEGRLHSIKRFFGAKRLSEISPFLIERFKVERRNSKIERHGSKLPAKPRSVASVNRELSLLSRIFSIAIMSKEVQTNPCRDVKPLSGEQPRTRYLLPDQEERLMDVLNQKPPYLAAIVALAVNTGMRRGELLRLEWDQIDFYREEIKAINQERS
jgi:integrase